MPEDFYAALMMCRALPTTTNIKTITAPGIYPVDAGNANAPGSAAGALIVLPPTTKPKLKFIKESDTSIYTLIGSDWKKPTATDVDAVPTARKVNGHPLSTDVDVLPGDIFKLATSIGDAADLNAYTAPGLYYQPANAQAATGKNYPEANAGSLEVYKHAGITQVYRVYNNSRHYIRTLYSGTWTAWSWVYDTTHKPTAGDVGALPTTGGTVTGATTFNYALTLKSGLELYGPQPYIDFHFGNSTADYTARLIENVIGNLQVLGSFSASKTITPADYSNFDARYYTKTQSDAGYMPKTSAYTKTESDARYLTDSRLGARNYRVMAKGTMYEIAGNVITGLQIEGQVDGDGDYIVMRPMQKLLNGTWYTVAQV